ncbi:hypothetical protein DdX_06116 [Ditylenchus destructor]|uniref:Uncharacterized protein n=1 Tax=Ditylenchus destructor TaxID=166010 RepID=A0AAD4NBU0_9BILA|nr:hypothetical protein DdX_06116 [Ditylenchus destructor]
MVNSPDESGSPPTYEISLTHSALNFQTQPNTKTHPCLAFSVPTHLGTIPNMSGPAFIGVPPVRQVQNGISYIHMPGDNTEIIPLLSFEYQNKMNECCQNAALYTGPGQLPPDNSHVDSCHPIVENSDCVRQ